MCTAPDTTTPANHTVNGVMYHHLHYAEPQLGSHLHLSQDDDIPLEFLHLIRMESTHPIVDCALRQEWDVGLEQDIQWYRDYYRCSTMLEAFRTRLEILCMQRHQELRFIASRLVNANAYQCLLPCMAQPAIFPPVFLPPPPTLRLSDLSPLACTRIPSPGHQTPPQIHCLHCNQHGHRSNSCPRVQDVSESSSNEDVAE